MCNPTSTYYLARLLIPTKIFLLSSMGPRDWQHVQNVVFVQDFPRLTTGSPPLEDFPNAAPWTPNFGQAMLDFLLAMGIPGAELDWIRGFGYETEAVFVGSRPVTANSSFLEQREKYGVNRLAAAVKVVRGEAAGGTNGQRRIEYATSSLGKLEEPWISDMARALQGLSFSAGLKKPELNVVFPTLRQMQSLPNGFATPGTGTICWERKYWDAMPASLRTIFRSPLSRDPALCSHSKFASVEVLEKGGGEVTDGWVYVGSHNFTVAAWGRRTAQGLRSALNWETGIVMRAPRVTRQTLSGTADEVKMAKPYGRLEQYGDRDVPFLRLEALRPNQLE